jgi:MinD superfamily P-loop ATPase
VKVHQCDNCKEVADEGELVIVGRDIFRHKVELCQECAAPIIASVKRSNLDYSLKERINMVAAKYTNQEPAV